MFYVYSIYGVFCMVQPAKNCMVFANISIERKLNKFLNAIKFMESNIANELENVWKEINLIPRLYFWNNALVIRFSV